MKIRRKNKEKKNEQYGIETANIVNNGLKLNIDEQQDDIKHLKEHLREKSLC